MTMYRPVADAVAALVPADWDFIDYEAVGTEAETNADTTKVTLKVRTIADLPQAPLGSDLVTWVVTVTTEYPDRERADPALFDQVARFRTALKTIGTGVLVGPADKTLSEDGLLAYDIDLTTISEKEEG
jgi:hypothetical protein